MKSLLLGAANAVRDAVAATTVPHRGVNLHHDSPGGDAQFDIDEVAERTVWEYITANTDVALAIYTEDETTRVTGADPQHLLIIDPIDGTRPAAAGLESSMVSIAVAPFRPDSTIGDITAAVLLELRTGKWLYTDDTVEGIESRGYTQPVPSLTDIDSLERMFWSIEFNGHPMGLMANAYSHIVDASANTGGVFVFNSSTYSISRLITGQLDAYVDIGNRVLRDHPDTRDAFLRSGRGNILHLFPYDIAAAVTIATKAGAIVTDAYGQSFSDVHLTDLSDTNQRSCVAASNPALHDLLLAKINW